jgi:hypothetical protein
MKWELALAVFLFLTVFVEAILALRPIPQSVSLQPRQDGFSKEPAGQMAFKN